MYSFCRMKVFGVISALGVFGLLIFVSGFLLVRYEVGEKSVPCSANNNEECLKLSSPSFKYEKLVVIIIDALRHDFIAFQDENPNPYFHNHLKTVKDLANKGCSSARVMRLIADSPTTTMQRIKGITTGSLPTFIDISNNFASSEITEDNLIDQLIKSDKRIIFMGDDTWLNLFPNRFTKSYPYSSFDVMDLDMVDDGVRDHLIPTIKGNEYDVIIAHFLGVDHCGHRYGPYHSEMTRKLKEMDDVLKDVVSTVTNDTLLLVLGDHGMTQSGDHGGATEQEVNAGLFAYSPVGAFKNCKDWVAAQNDVVNQIDLVPTISVLLGIAIPYSNLGVVIDSMFPYDKFHDFKADGTAEKKTVEALFTNAKQVYEYLQSYQQATNGLPRRKLDEMNLRFNYLSEKVKTIEKSDTREMKEELHEYISDVGNMCRVAWAQFNVHYMMAGINIVSLSLLTALYGNIGNRLKLKQTIIGFSAIVIFNLTILHVSEFLSMLVSVLTFLAITFNFCLHCFLILHRNQIFRDSIIFSVVVTLFFVLGFTSNSFILNEDVITNYITISILCFMTYMCLSKGLQQSFWNSQKNFLNENVAANAGITRNKRSAPRKSKNKKDDTNFITSESMKAALTIICVFASICIRFSLMFRRRRPEQFWLTDYQSLTSDEVAVDNFTISTLWTSFMRNYWQEESKHIRVLVSSISLGITIWCILKRIKKDGNLKNMSAFNVLVVNRLQIFTTVCVCIYWFLDAAPKAAVKILPDWYLTLFPLVCYVTFAISILCLCVSPVMLHLLYPDGYGGYSEVRNCISKESAVQKYYQRLKNSYNEENKANEDSKVDTTPVAFGLYTVFTAPVLAFLLCFVNLLAMLIGPSYAPALLLWLFANYCVLGITAIYSQLSMSSIVPLCSVVLWEITASWFWFAMGHQATVTSLQWKAAFVGFQGNHNNNYIPAILLVLNTFSTHIFSTISLPLLMLWPITRGKWFFNNITQSGQTYSSELVLFKDASQFWKIFNNLLTKHVAFYALRLLACMVAAHIHRRHLMAWAIFAPHFLFEAVGFLVVLASSYFVYFILWRTGCKLTSWLNYVDNLLQDS